MKAFAVIVLVLSVAGSLAAQDGPTDSVFAGYQYYRFDDGGAPQRVSFNGLDFDLAGMLTDHLALVGDAGGVFRNGVRIYTLMGGPRLTAPRGKWDPFAEALIGLSRFSDPTGTNTELTAAFGGGVDRRATRRFSVRVAKFDYMWVRLGGGGHLSEYRLASGLVFRF